jgi:hypothetical protein
MWTSPNQRNTKSTGLTLTLNPTLHVRTAVAKMLLVIEEMRQRSKTFTLRFESRIHGGDLQSLQKMSEILILNGILKSMKVGV